MLRASERRARRWGRKRKGKRCGSSLVTRGALLGIKPVRSDAEHVVALDAHAVDDGTDDGTRLGRSGQAGRRGSGRLLRDALGGHEPILTRRGMASKGAGAIRAIHAMYQ